MTTSATLNYLMRCSERPRHHCTRLMRISILLFLFACAVTFAEEPAYRLSHHKEMRSASVAQAIVIPKIAFRDARWSDILRELERLSVLHDPSKKGVRFFVPDRFKTAFASIAKSRFTAEVKANSTLIAVFDEVRPPYWMFYPTSAREVALIPVWAVIDDLPE